MFSKFKNSIINQLFFGILIFIWCQKVSSQESIKKADSLLKTGDFEISYGLYQAMLSSTEDSTHLARAYIGLGKIKLVQSEFDASLENYLKAESLTQTKNQENLLDIYTGIGVVHSKLKNFQKAIIYLQKALYLATKEDLQRLKVLVNLAGVYVETDNAEALLTYQKALRLAKKLHRVDIQAIIDTNLSNFYIEKRDWKLARAHAEKSLEIRAKLQMPNSVITYNNYGYALIQLGQFKQGIDAYKNALPNASLQEKKQVLFNLMNAYKVSGDYKESLRFYQKYDAIKDSIAANKYREKIAAIQTAYETEKNKKKIEHLEIENAHKEEEFQRLIVGGILLLILLAVITLLYIKNQRVKEELSKSKLMQRLLQVQLNPHFLFNALQQIQFYIFKNEKEKSMEYLSNFSRLIRLILETSNKEYIPLSEEVEMLDNYLYLQQTAASTKFAFSIVVKTETDSSVLQIPVMLLQPFIENAVLHGVNNHPNGEIKILFKEEKQNQQVIVEITDNGKGIQQQQKLDHQRLHKSMGSSILNDRVREYNKTHTQKIQLQILEVEKNKEFPGTRIILKIPYQDILN